jgi:hypothetical protein
MSPSVQTYYLSGVLKALPYGKYILYLCTYSYIIPLLQKKTSKNFRCRSLTLHELKWSMFQRVPPHFERIISLCLCISWWKMKGRTFGKSSAKNSFIVIPTYSFRGTVVVYNVRTCFIGWGWKNSQVWIMNTIGSFIGVVPPGGGALLLYKDRTPTNFPLKGIDQWKKRGVESNIIQ